MPGQVGTATAPGQQRNSAATSPLDIDDSLGDDGTFSSPPLRNIGLSGLSINVDRTALGALGALSLVVQIRIDSDTAPWRTLGIPCCCDPTTLDDIPAGATGLAFVSWDHIAARQARFVASGVAGEAMGAITLMATAN